METTRAEDHAVSHGERLICNVLHCPFPATATVQGICKHEHMEVHPMCDVHRGILEDWVCLECDDLEGEDWHVCEMTSRVFPWSSTVEQESE